MFWRKQGILILDLYLYSIKIQTDIDQNTVIKLQKNHKFFEIIFEEFFFFIFYLGLDLAGPTWLGRTQHASCEQWNSISLFAWIIFGWTVKCACTATKRVETCGGNDVEDNGEHSQWCWWWWRGSQWRLTVVLKVAVVGKLDDNSCFLFFFPFAEALLLLLVSFSQQCSSLSMASLWRRW